MTPTVADSAHIIGALGSCPHGEYITYRANLESSGHNAVATAVQVAAQAGHLVDSTLMPTDRWYATIDILTADGDIVQDFQAPSEQSWHWWLRAAELRPIASDCRECCR